jgi:hypothetical protein
MLVANEPTRQIKIPRSFLVEERSSRSYVRRVRALASLHQIGIIAEPTFIDDQGALIPEEQAREMRALVDPAVFDLRQGPAAHARRTIAEIEASRKSDAEQVDDLLGTVYRAHAKGERAKDVLDPFLDTFERWLCLDGVLKVDILFARVDLERAPASLGILLLSTTRVTRESFARRAEFIERLRGFLVGREGRTERSVDNMLRGLRE